MTKLCPRGKAAAKRKFKVYPSAYANAYASKICAGKIKDPSGTKRKDWGPKKANKGLHAETKKKSKKKVMPGDPRERHEYLKKIQNPISEYDRKGKLKYTAANKGLHAKTKKKKATMEINYGKQPKDKMKTKPYGIEDRKIKIEKLLSREDSQILRKEKGIGLLASPSKSYSGLLQSPKKKKSGGGIAIRGTNFKGVF
jgi:hypothetical protein